jgi:hypothetical protein
MFHFAQHNGHAASKDATSVRQQFGNNFESRAVMIRVLLRRLGATEPDLAMTEITDLVLRWFYSALLSV